MNIIILTPQCNCKPAPLFYILFFIFLCRFTIFTREYLFHTHPSVFPILHDFINNPRPVHKKILIARTYCPRSFLSTNSLILRLPTFNWVISISNQASERSRSSKFFSLLARNWLGDSTLNKFYYRTLNLITLGTTPKTNISRPHHGCNKKNICTYFKND